MTLIRPATPADLPAIGRLLTTADLPVTGVAEHLGSFLVAVDDEAVVGSAGLEIHGHHGLLRSVAVTPDQRRSGLGRRLVDEALALARSRRLLSITLLTTTAADYFPRFGFRQIEQAAAPEPVKQSTQFRGACPASAVAMLLDLAYGRA